MKAKEEAADQAQPLISDTTDSVIKGSDHPPADEIERQRRMSLLDARKSLVTGDDGYVVFWPTSNVGAYTSYDLREIADELDKRNASWDAIIQSDPRTSGAAIRNTPQADDPEEGI